MLQDFTRAIRRTAGLLFLAACTLGAAEPNTRIEQLRATLLSTGPELTRQFVIARAEIEAGRAEDGWTPELKVSARTWLDGLIPPVAGSVAPVEPHSLHPRRRSGISYRSAQPHHLPPPAALLAEKVSGRLRAISSIHGGWWGDYCKVVAQQAEEAWLQARHPADLRPALRMLEDFKELALDPAPATDPNRAVFPFPMIRRAPNGVEIRTGEDEPLSALLLFSGPEPLILTDPTTDPESYKQMRMRWHDLEGWQLRFCSRFLVERRVRELDREFNRAAAAAQAKWEQLVVAQAPVPEIAAAWQRLETFHVPTEMSHEPVSPVALITGRSIASRPSAPPARPANRPEFVHTFPADYRELLALPTGKRPGSVTAVAYFRPVLDPEPYTSGGDLMAYLKAEANPGSTEVEALRGHVLKAWPRYSRTVKDWLPRKLGVNPFGPTVQVEKAPEVPAALPPLTREESPLQAVRTALQAAASPLNEGGPLPGADALLAHWRRLQGEEPGDGSRPLGEMPILWAQLAARPGGAALLSARDQALRLLLKNPVEEPSHEALPSLLERQLEAAVTASDWPRLQRLLLIEQTAGIFLPTEAELWRRLADALPAALEGDATAARPLLYQSVSPALARLAAERLKAAKKSPATR